MNSLGGFSRKSLVGLKTSMKRKLELKNMEKNRIAQAPTSFGGQLAELAQGKFGASYSREMEYHLKKQESKRRLQFNDNRVRRRSMVEDFNVPSDDIIFGFNTKTNIAPMGDGESAPMDHVIYDDDDHDGNMSVVMESNDDDNDSKRMSGKERKSYDKNNSFANYRTKESFFMTDQDRESDPEREMVHEQQIIKSTDTRGLQGSNSPASGDRRDTKEEGRYTKEYEKHMAKLENPYVFCPYHANRRIWDILISIVVMYLIVVIPLEICISWYEPSGGSKVLGTCIDILFWIDILLNFNTGFVHFGVLYMNRSDISRRYIKGWFFIDFVGNFPFELVLGDDMDGSQRKSVKLLKWAKLPKLLRIGRVIKYLKQYIKFASIVSLVFTALCTIHFLACLWIFLMYQEEDQEDFTLPGLWLKAVHEVIIQMLGGVPPTFAVPDIATQDLSQSVISLAAVFVAEKQLNASSFNDFIDRIKINLESSNNTHNCHHYGCEKFPHWFSIICVIIGFSFLIMFGANVSILVNNQTSSYTKFRTRVDRLQVEMGYHNLPRGLQARVMKYYDYLWLNQKHHEKDSLHRDPNLSDTLRKEIGCHIHADILSATPLFNKCSSDCLSMVALRLKTWIALANDIIVEQGDVGREFFMIALGSVEIVEKHTQTIVTNLAEGSFFGEIALLTKCRRSHSVIAKTLSELNVLSKEDFSEIVKDYPRLLKNAWLAAKKRQRDQINRNKKSRQASVNAAGTPADVNLVLIPSYSETLKIFNVVEFPAAYKDRSNSFVKLPKQKPIPELEDTSSTVEDKVHPSEQIAPAPDL